jgi:hypothetical protein
MSLCMLSDTYVWHHEFGLADLPAIHAFCLEEDRACGAP